MMTTNGKAMKALNKYTELFYNLLQFQYQVENCNKVSLSNFIGVITIQHPLIISIGTAYKYYRYACFTPSNLMRT